MKKLLVVVDYQTDFVNGSLGFKNADKIEEKLVKRIEDFIKENNDVIFTKDVHDDNYLKSEEGKHLPIKHCLKGSKGAELFGKLKQYENKFPVLEKETFGSLELGNFIKDKNYEEVVIVGLVSYICVLSNAVIAKSALPNAHIVVEKDLVGASDLYAQEIGFEALKNIHVEIR